jgi:subfamily B ATP-binding cassette protein MsbA
LVSLLFFYRALSTIITVQNHWNTFLSLSGSVDNIQAFQKELAQNYEPKGQIEIKNVTTAVELKDIVLELGNAKILNNISLILNKNETIALVGESGSGKTSLVNLITTLFHPDQGIMLIDGKDIKSLDLGSYQTQIGYITQDPVIFTASIYDNISFWDEKNEDNLLRFNEAVKRAAIFEFIETLPEKEMTELGLGGINLSGGQKQRINIARELYKNPSILIFDEATSSLDTETENLIKSNIEDLHGHCTIIIIAHRLSTIRNADRIIILHQGRISGEGTFDELLKTNERFRHMIKLQEF